MVKSSAETKYRAMALSTCELIWLKQLFEGVKMWKRWTNETDLWNWNWTNETSVSCGRTGFITFICLKLISAYWVKKENEKLKEKKS